MDQQLELIHATFFQECDELLAELEHQLCLLKRNVTDAEPLHAAFRAIHSIKGGAGMLGFGRVVDFAHTFENALRQMRAGRIEISENIVDAAILANDVVADLVRAARAGTEPQQNFELEAAERLAAMVGIELQATVPEVGAVATWADRCGSDAPNESAPRAGSSGHAKGWRFVYQIAFVPHRQMLRRLNEPLLILRQLQQLGELTVEADISQMPAFSELVPTDAYLAWRMTLETSAGLAKVEEAFEFVEGECLLSIACIEDRGQPGAEETDGDATLALEAPERPSVAANGPAAAGRSQWNSSLRVDLDRIDRLVDMVGEIAVTQTMIYQHIDQSFTLSNPRLFNELSQLLKLTQSLQDSVMAIRAQPIRSVFARLPRVVRELVSQTGKKVRLETSGENTEIDKSIIEQLIDPLTHIVRNAVDHGIESSDERAAMGKPAEGKVVVGAAQRGSQIVIEISDDGRGIDREKIRRKAVEERLIAADTSLTEEEINNLIFLPGFSTAETVSHISGRGVGMDVVRRNIQKLGGRIGLSSQPGRGSKVTLTLPLTVAVIDSMIVRAGQGMYVIPICNIVECLAVSRQQVTSIPGSGEVLNVRGGHVRLVRLATVFGVAEAAPVGPSPHLMVVLVEVDGDQTIALVVSEIVGQQQVVMKSIRENFDQVPGIAGAAILGDGAIALFLDVNVIAAISAVGARRHQSHTLHSNFGKQVA